MTRRYRPSKHQRRMEDFARIPKLLACPPHRGKKFSWSAAQKRAEDQIFLFRKWIYDNSRITAYGVNMRLAMRRSYKPHRTPKGDRT